MSAAKRGGRFSYLTNADQSTEMELPQEGRSGPEIDGGSVVEREESRSETDSSDGGGDGRGSTSSTQELAGVPKGTGRMKQERSQLNVRVPTTLKRQAAAKAVLEGRDIGEVVEELLRAYLER